VALVTVLMVLVGAIYSSSTFIAFGIEKNCIFAPNDIDTICSTFNNNGKITKVQYCYPGKTGEVCITVYQAAAGSAIDPDLRNAIENAEVQTATEDTQNTTKVPKGLLNDGGILKEQGDNQTTSERIVDPEDRFCKQGTGPRLGTPCVPCNPGEANCIDQVTGGLLDTPDAATSESEEEDDTNPKDLGGLNNDDENGPEVNPGTD